MGRSLTNNFNLTYCIEASLGTAGTDWFQLEPNSIDTYGAETTNTPRAPISKNRQRRKGSTTDLDSSVEFEHDLTAHAFTRFIEGFVMASWTGPASMQAGTDFDTLAAVAAGPNFTHGALAAAIPAGSLVVSKGWGTAANNLTDEVDTGGTTTSTPIVTGPVVNETPTEATGATLEVCGFRGATADITWTDATDTIGSTVVDFTDLNLTAGQFLHVGGTAAANQYAGGVALGRIVSIAANAIVLDKVVKTLSADDAGTGKRIDLLFGRFLRNVSTDDSDFLEQSYQFEGTYVDLQNPSGDEYEYSIGNYANEAGFSLPLTSKAGVSFAFIGTDTETFVTSQKTGADAPIDPVGTDAFNTSADIIRLRITEVDETGLTTDFKSATLTLNNNVSPEKVLGTLGAKYLNVGTFEVNLEAELLFTDSGVITAIRDNDTVTMDFLITNDDGAIAVDLPSLTLGGGARDFPVNESIKASLTGEAFEDATLGTSVGVSMFPIYPAV